MQCRVILCFLRRILVLRPHFTSSNGQFLLRVILLKKWRGAFCLSLNGKFMVYSSAGPTKSDTWMNLDFCRQREFRRCWLCFTYRLFVRYCCIVIGYAVREFVSWSPRHVQKCIAVHDNHKSGRNSRCSLFCRDALRVNVYQFWCRTGRIGKVSDGIGEVAHITVEWKHQANCLSQGETPPRAKDLRESATGEPRKVWKGIQYIVFDASYAYKLHVPVYNIDLTWLTLL